MLTQRHKEVKGLDREPNRFGFGLNIHYFAYFTSQCGNSNISAHVKNWTSKVRLISAKFWIGCFFYRWFCVCREVFCCKELNFIHFSSILSRFLVVTPWRWEGSFLIYKKVWHVERKICQSSLFFYLFIESCLLLT